MFPWRPLLVTLLMACFNAGEEFGFSAYSIPPAPTRGTQPSGLHHPIIAALGESLGVIGLGSRIVGPQSPVVGPQSPVVGPQSPVVGTLSPVVGTLSPVVGTQSPVVGTLSPVVGLGSPLVDPGSPVTGPPSLVMGLGSPHHLAESRAIEETVAEANIGKESTSEDNLDKNSSWSVEGIVEEGPWRTVDYGAIQTFSERSDSTGWNINTIFVSLFKLEATVIILGIIGWLLYQFFPLPLAFLAHLFAQLPLGGMDMVETETARSVEILGSVAEYVMEAYQGYQNLNHQE